jgi:hypothetical protein
MASLIVLPVLLRLVRQMRRDRLARRAARAALRQAADELARVAPESERTQKLG